MNKGAFAKKTHEQDVEFFKKWLCDTTPINIRQGLEEILSTIPYSSLKELQIRHTASKLLNSMSFEDRNTLLDIESMVTLNPESNYQVTLRANVSSRLKFVKS